ncbi:MAG: isoleucine--tRNA ligase [Chloroflexi bacterium]|nr:isoleucine--tRNA ligase [Chloroflexota bacterium]MCI0782902.1 isoleucine--tRNA ligase [Chloroflexota bacterium]MCI0813647.1 isoleucine--tRNA ligase [Chloroflexota bacterium]MCI0818963.1 isoleucine--tRNA ligase [Chloroflexota bacterium]MCI0831158.1 isoleucine--tRNA ligase [Chloroflexota bacterium]
MFDAVDSRQSFPRLEEEILEFWKRHDTFKKSVEARPEDKPYVFYEGPPTANARPGVHHVLTRAFKDLFPRYKTMRGYRVPRKGGWDTHGLPVELEVERELGLKSKLEIEKFGVEEFNRRCRESVFRYVKEWAKLTERIAFWIDMDDPYITYDNEYIESVWWVIKSLWDKGLIYQDRRSTPHCPRCETSLSDAEVALGYKENTPDPSVSVKFRLTAESLAALGDKLPAAGGAVYVVAWTTTPWTLPGNTALAVKPDATYSVYEVEGSRIVVASERRQDVPEEATEVATLPGSALVGLHYEPLYEPVTWGVPASWFDPAQDGRLASVDDLGTVENAYVVLGGEFVSLDDGTGVVHVAPAFGAEDFQLGKENGLLFLQPVDLRGNLPDGSPWAGQFVKDADAGIMDDLTERGLLFKRGEIRHTYPFCWRCDTPLLYYAKPTWYIRTTAVKDRLIESNEKINWYPDHIKHGRFGNWLQNNVDWALSRERYWGTPLPVWGCTSCGANQCIGSRVDLKERAVDPAAVDALDDFHRPYIDRIELKCTECGGVAKRAPELMDVWLDSGAMPYAQWHYPRENEEKFRANFPADFICEAVDQTRGWFYTLHAEAVLLNSVGEAPESIAFRNVISTGHILDEKGRKMSKSLGNAADPFEVIEQTGADALRWYLYTATRPGDARRFSIKLVQESLRRFFLTYWNTYSFFVTYANLDDFDPTQAGAGEPTELDRWVLSELNALVQKVTDGLDDYDPTTTGRAIQDFVTDLSNWYVRRSRRRFWRGEMDEDKVAAYQTLYTCLVTVSKLLAPFAPFVAEAVYRNLVCSVDKEAPESVHLTDWPEAEADLVDQALMDETRLVMRVVSLGRAARQKSQMKVRQPLASATAFVQTTAQKEPLARLAAQVTEELNVKELRIKALSEEFTGDFTRPDDVLAAAGEGHVLAEDDSGYAVAVDTRLTPELADEGVARELVHRLQNLRKAAGLEISDRIVAYHGDSERVAAVLAAHGDYVRAETLADELVAGDPPDGATAEQVKIEGAEVTLAVRKA